MGHSPTDAINSPQDEVHEAEGKQVAVEVEGQEGEDYCLEAEQMEWDADGLEWRGDAGSWVCGSAIDGLFANGWGRRNLGDDYQKESHNSVLFDAWMESYCLNPEVDLGIRFSCGLSELLRLQPTLDHWLSEASDHYAFKELDLGSLDSVLLTRYLPAFAFPERQPLVYHRFHLWDLLWFLRKNPQVLAALMKPNRLRTTERFVS